MLRAEGLGQRPWTRLTHRGAAPAPSCWQGWRCSVKSAAGPFRSMGHDFQATPWLCSQLHSWASAACLIGCNWCFFWSTPTCPFLSLLPLETSSQPQPCLEAQDAEGNIKTLPWCVHLSTGACLETRNVPSVLKLVLAGFCLCHLLGLHKSTVSDDPPLVWLRLACWSLGSVCWCLVAVEGQPDGAATKMLVRCQEAWDPGCL